MLYEGGGKEASLSSSSACSFLPQRICRNGVTPRSRQQRRPGRIGRIARGRDLLLVAAGDVDRKERRPLAEVAEEHHHAAVRREGRPLIVVARCEQPLARAVRL